MTSRTRYAPDQPFPPYAHQPGQTPHPRTHPKGHSYDIPEYAGAAFSEQTWSRCTAYLYGIDLFNHQYYWEAHEAWEGLWKATPRSAAPARFLQGLIQLAAMRIKMRDGNGRGADKLRVKALSNLTRATGEKIYMGIDLRTVCQHIAHAPCAAFSLTLTL